MSLTQQQKQLVKHSFAKVEPIAEQAAAQFYQKLFEYDPSLKPLFGKSIDEQGKKLMATLALAVASLDDIDALVPTLQHLARRHLDYGVKVEDYTPVGNALLFALSKGLGADFTPETRQAWIETYTLIATVMRQEAYPDYHPQRFRNRKRYHHL